MLGCVDGKATTSSARMTATRKECILAKYKWVSNKLLPLVLNTTQRLEAEFVSQKSKNEYEIIEYSPNFQATLRGIYLGCAHDWCEFLGLLDRRSAFFELTQWPRRGGLDTAISVIRQQDYHILNGRYHKVGLKPCNPWPSRKWLCSEGSGIIKLKIAAYSPWSCAPSASMIPRHDMVDPRNNRHKLAERNVAASLIVGEGCQAWKSVWNKTANTNRS